MLLKDKLAVITGCNRGIGQAIVLRFAEEGAEIFACVRKPGAAFASLVDQLAAEKGARITPFYFDFRNSEEIKAATRDIIAHKRKIDVLVNNGGIAAGALFHMTPMADMRDLFEVNFFGPLQFTQGISRYMARYQGGSIVNMASTAGLLADAGMTSYGASKAALIHATRTLATELGASRVRVNAIAPSITRSDMYEQMEAKARTQLIERSALKRAAEVVEVANVAVFLASDLSSFMTGQVLRVDGGMA